MRTTLVMFLMLSCGFGYASQEFDKWKNDLSRFENKVLPMEVNLVDSAGDGNLAEVKLILENSTIDVNAIYKGKTALINAVEKRKYEVVKYLLSKGADINLGSAVNWNQFRRRYVLANSSFCWMHALYYNITPLMLAVMNNDGKMAVLLLAGGPDLTVKAICREGARILRDFIVDSEMW